MHRRRRPSFLKSRAARWCVYRLAERTAAWPACCLGIARSPARGRLRWKCKTQPADTASASLEKLQQHEEEYPECAHRVPVPDGGVDEDLASGELSRRAQIHERRDQPGEAEEEMRRVRNREDVEEVAARIGAQKNLLRGQLLP